MKKVIGTPLSPLATLSTFHGVTPDPSVLPCISESSYMHVCWCVMWCVVVCRGVVWALEGITRDHKGSQGITRDHIRMADTVDSPSGGTWGTV